jgi:hypothetical protein
VCRSRYKQQDGASHEGRDTGTAAFEHSFLDVF